MNYFKILNMKEEFGIDLEELEAKYLELQKTLHPDTIGGSSGISKIVDINEAYRVLKNDYLRARALLKYNFHIDLGDEHDARKYTNTSLLSEIMLEMEALEGKNNIEALEQAKNKASVKKAALISDIVKGFEEKAIELLAQNIVHLKYYDKLIENMNIKIEECY
ncbi:MAG: Fe-S protein assembly co-chaperone HscB [Rickettsiaceae bacterium]|nr:Fe-S protein assembly co-chaperone HscB [Rickettsiaceae bacterium]